MFRITADKEGFVMFKMDINYGGENTAQSIYKQLSRVFHNGTGYNLEVDKVPDSENVTSWFKGCEGEPALTEKERE